MAGSFDRDTAVQRQSVSESEALFTAEISPDWRAGRGPHGGYLAAILLRALMETVDDETRAPRSLTIHYPRAPEPGPVSIHTVVERAGRSLSTLSARMERDGSLCALALAAFSVPWNAPEIAEMPMPAVAPADPARQAGTMQAAGGPAFTRHLIFQQRVGNVPFSGSERPMEVAGWLGLADRRPLDSLSLAFFCDALFPPVLVRLAQPAVCPTVDLTIHFRSPLRASAQGSGELCFARFNSNAVHEGFFEEDGVIWAADGTVLAHSRQLAILMPLKGA
jgi:acyl-CoA thioesterase